MTDTNDVDALRDLYAEPGPEADGSGRIRELLAEGQTLDERARQKRIAAGWLLIQLRADHPKEWRRKAGISAALADRLIQLTNQEVST